MYEAERAREASEAYPMGGEGGVTYEEYTSEEMSYVGGGSVEGYETVDVAAPMGGEYYGEQPYYEEPAVYAPTGVGVSVLGVGVGGGVGYVGAYGKAPDAARAQAQAPAPAQAPAQAPAKAPAPQQVVPVVQVKPSAARAAAAAATTPAAGAATTTPASGHRHAGDANFIEYCVRLNLPFEGRQGDLADPAVRVRRIDAHTILEACKTAQQKLLPDQRTISNPETLDLGHVFVGDVTLEVLHNTFTRSFTVTCTSHAGLNNSVGPGGRKTCFFVGEDGHVSYPDLCLVDRRHLLKDGLFIQVAGETADRVLREPFIKVRA
jgi:nucleoid-associated protein YgaU